MRVQAKTIIKKKQLISTSLEHEFLYQHFNKNLGFAKINVNTKSCTCHKYFEKGVCKHLVAACLKLKIYLPGLVQLPKKFMVIRRKKHRNYVDDSRENSALEVDGVEDDTTDQQLQPPVQPKKRGRKPKNANEILAEDNEPIGRTPMARGALEFEGPRRSQRNKKKT
jgi:uncharacterized Zn finger protein